MYKRNMFKNKHLNDRGNQIKRIQYTKQRNKVTALRKYAIRDYFMSKCKPYAFLKDFWNAVGPFLTSKNRFERSIILKEDDHIVTDVPELCELFMKYFFKVANSNSIGDPDEINIHNSNFLAEVLDKNRIMKV